MSSATLRAAEPSSSADPSAFAEPELETVPTPPPAVVPVAVAPNPAQNLSSTSSSASIGVPPYVTPLPMVGGLTAPGYLTALAQNRSVLLSWYPSEGNGLVSGYLVFRGDSPDQIPASAINKATVTENNYSDSDDSSFEGPKNRHTYYYRVRAYNTEGRLTSYSDVVSAQPNGPLLPPGKVEASESDGKVLLRWSPPLSSGDHEFAALQVYRAAAPGGGELVKELPMDAASYEDAGLENGKPYYYTLKAKDDQGNLSPPSPELKAVAYKALAPPTGLSALGVGDEAVRLKWAAPDAQGTGTFKVKGYNLYRSTQAPVDLSSRPVNKALIPAGRTKWEDGPEDSVEAPKKGSNYHYVLVAVDEEGKASPPSVESVGGPTESLTGLHVDNIDVGGNTLKIEGRKTINASNTWVIQSAQPTANGVGQAGGFQLDQQLQVRLTGKVGRKIKVDVDYDDKAVGSQQQKISVVYTGDQQEVFKEFAFGDIVMDLNSNRTEFAGYNKNLFGAKLKLESPDSRLRLTAIGAQTKGFTETKRFVGGYEQVKNGTTLGRDIPDSAFQSRKYFYLTREKAVIEGGDYIEPDSVDIWLDQPGYQNLAGNRAVDDPGGTGKFYFIQQAKSSYTVDNSTGLINFNYVGISARDNIAVAFKIRRSNGTVDSVGYNSAGSIDFGTGMNSAWDTGLSTNSAHLIQYGNRYPSQYDSHMSFQFYSLGNQNILNPQLDPDFKMVIYGTNQTPVFQLDARSNFSDVVNFDPRSGTMVFRVPFPFAKTGGTPDLQMDPAFNKVEDLFDNKPLNAYNQTSTTPNYTIHVEYKYKLPSYSLRIGIIKGSEYITLDGRKLARDTDYYLDPDSGYLTFNNPDLVKDNSVVEVTYEYLPFGGQFTSTIWGTRGEYDINKNLSLGSTFIWNSSDATQEVPDVRNSPYSVQILDGDIQASFPQDALDSLTHLLPGLGDAPTPLKVGARAEAAKSWFRPNTYTKNNESGVAMVDSFEAVDRLVSTSVDENTWFPAASPVQTTNGPQMVFSDRRFSRLSNIQARAHDATQRAANNENPNRTMLEWTYGGFTTPNNWDAFVYSFGQKAPEDLNNASYLEVWVKVDTGPVTLHFDVGTVNHDADGNGVLDTESTTGFLGKDQDIGFYNSSSVRTPGYPLPEEAPSLYQDVSYWGGGNKIIDTEDINGRGSLQTLDNFYQFSVNLAPVSNPETGDFQLVQIPLTSAGIVGPAGSLSVVPGTSNFFTNVLDFRMWIDHVGAAGATSGRLTIESVQFKGNKWQLRADPNVVSYGGVSATADTSKFQVNAINRINAKTVAPGLSYSPNLNFFNKATSGSEDREQSLQLEYNLTRLEQNNGQPFYQARRSLSSSLVTDYDFANYQKLRVDVYKPLTTLPGERLLIRLVKDDQNYFEYQIFLDQLPTGAWQTVTLALDGSDGKRTQYGQPYLRNVRSVALAIHTLNDNPPPSGKEYLWLNNLRVTDAIVKEGGAQRLGLTYDLMNGSVVVTEDLREVESDFVKIDEQANAPQRRERKHTLDGRVNVVQGMPVTARYEETLRFTEAKRRDDPLYTRNFVDPDESSNKTSAGIGFTKVPNLVVNASGSVEHVRQIFLPTYVNALRLLPGINDPGLVPDNNRDNLRLANDNTFTVPDKVWGLRNDILKAEVVYDESRNVYDRQTSNLANISYLNTDQETRTLRGRYTGQQYKWGPWGTWVTLSPSYGYTLVESMGNIPQPNVRGAYYQLGPDRRAKDYVPQSRSINPSLQMQFESLGLLRNPRVTYNFTQTRDYVRNELRSPGNLDLATSFDLNSLAGPGGKLPAVDFTQSFAVDSTTNNEPRIRGSERSLAIQQWFNANPSFRDRYPDPNNSGNLQNIPSIALAEQQSPLQSTWWVRLEDPTLGEAVNDPLNIEDIAQNSTKRSATSFATHFELPLSQDWTGTLSPRLNLSNDRTMSAPEQVARRNQLGYGTGLDFPNPKVPFWQFFKPSNLALTYDYTVVDQYVVGYVTEERTHEQNNSGMSATLPTRPTDRNAVTFKVAWTGGKDISFTNINHVEKVASVLTTNTWVPAIKWVYFLNVDRPWKMPDMWPFYGRELRIRQNFRLDNDFDITYVRNTQDANAGVLPATSTDTYALRNQLGYNVLDNVTLNFILDQKVFQDNSTLEGGRALVESKNYYAIKFELGLEARF